MSLHYKKVIAAILTLSLTFSLMACGNAADVGENTLPTEIVTENTTNTQPPVTESDSQNTVVIESSDANSATEPSPSSTKSLYQHGMDVVALMDEMLQNDFYLEAMSGSSDIQAKAEELARGNYSNPKAVYQITPLPFTSLMVLLEGETDGLEELSPTLLAHLDTKSAPALLNRLNAMDGALTLATTAAFTAGKTFVSGMVTENIIYLYTFETGYPIAIIFTKGEGGAVSATGTFLMTDTISTESLDKLKSSLQELAMLLKIEELEIK